MPYLELKKEEEQKQEAVMKNVIGLNQKEIKEQLKDFEIEIINENPGLESKVYKQIPEEGVTIKFRKQGYIIYEIIF